METNLPLFSLAYFGPADWFAKLISFPVVMMEQHEHYRKQTWRNRCRIDGPNGFPELSIPVIAANHTPLKDVRISYSENWQRQHWRTITTSYRRAPFFEYYEDEIRSFYENEEHELLISFNLAITQFLLRKLKLSNEIRLSTGFVTHYNSSLDFRETFSPKKKNQNNLLLPSYIQVFSDRHTFQPGLSMLDLLCCEGPAALSKLTVS